MNLVDSCGWMEFFTDGHLADKYYSYLKHPRNLIVPAIILYEVYKTIKMQGTEEEALLAIAQIQNSKIIPLTESIALEAADLSLEYKLPMADAIIYATANIMKAKVITSDVHFEKLPNVVYLKK